MIPEYDYDRLYKRYRDWIADDFVGIRAFAAILHVPIKHGMSRHDLIAATLPELVGADKAARFLGDVEARGDRIPEPDETAPTPTVVSRGETQAKPRRRKSATFKRKTLTFQEA